MTETALVVMLPGLIMSLLDCLGRVRANGLSDLIKPATMMVPQLCCKRCSEITPDKLSPDPGVVDRMSNLLRQWR